MLDVDVLTPRSPTAGWPTVRTAVLIVAVLSSGILAGFFLTYGFTIMPGLETTDDDVFITAFQGLERMFGTFEYGVNWPVIVGYLGGPTVMVAAIVLHRRCRPLRDWLSAALVLTLVTIAITQLVNVPLNEAITAAGDPSVAEAAPVRTDFGRTGGALGTSLAAPPRWEPLRACPGRCSCTVGR